MNNNKKILFLILILLIDFYLPLRIKKNFTRTVETNN